MLPFLSLSMDCWLVFSHQIHFWEQINNPKLLKQIDNSCTFVISDSAAAAAKSLQSCLTLSDPMDCSPPGPSVHGIFQARVLEWGAIAFSGSVTLTISKCKIKINHVVKYFLKSLKHSMDRVALICAWMDVFLIF